MKAVFSKECTQQTGDSGYGYDMILPNPSFVDVLPNGGFVPILAIHAAPSATICQHEQTAEVGMVGGARECLLVGLLKLPFVRQ